MWIEIEQVKNENRRELNLSGAEISERIAKDGLDSDLFELISLNSLKITDSVLKALPPQVSNLSNLQTLLLYGNEIDLIPDSIGQLSKLNVLDLSRNKLKCLPESVAHLVNLKIFNVSNNLLATLPSMKGLSKLATIDISCNQLTIFPGICFADNCNLSEVHLKYNSIDSIPHEIDQLTSLKQLSIAHNKIKTIPKSIASITKLKDLDLADNPLSDKRLLKLVQQCRSKQVFDYVRKFGEDRPKLIEKSNDSNDNKSCKSKKKSFVEDAPKFIIKVNRYDDETVQVIYDETVQDIRPHILCCIVQNVDISGDKFRKFIQLQKQLHDSVCGKRTKSTIATHDLDKLVAVDNSIRYTARDPNQIEIQPLGKSEKMTAKNYFDKLTTEAGISKTEKKRNVYSGIYKYLNLIENEDLFPCVEDSSGNVISLPPLTNGDSTKISESTTNLLLEVTSSISAASCVAAMEELLMAMAVDNFTISRNETEVTQSNVLDVKQVKISNMDGRLRRVYPAKGDLLFEGHMGIIVERE